MSGARSTVLTTCASTPLLSAGGLCWPTAVPIPIPATSVSSQATNRSERLLPIAPSVGWVNGIGGRRVARPATLGGEARAFSDRLLAHLPPSLEGLRQRHLVGVLEVAADREAARDAGDPRREGLQELAEVDGRGLALH